MRRHICPAIFSAISCPPLSGCIPGARSGLLSRLLLRTSIRNSSHREPQCLTCGENLILQANGRLCRDLVDPQALTTHTSVITHVSMYTYSSMVNVVSHHHIYSNSLDTLEDSLFIIQNTDLVSHINLHIFHIFTNQFARYNTQTSQCLKSKQTLPPSLAQLC